MEVKDELENRFDAYFEMASEIVPLVENRGGGR